VLAALAADANEVVPVPLLIDRVWGDRPPNGAREALYSHLARVRRALADAGPGARIVRRSGGYLLEIDPDRVDLHRFRRLVARARAAGCPDAERAAALREALGLWRGQPLTGISGPWADRMREAWHQRYLDAVVVWADAGTDAATVADRLAGLCAENPLLEPLAAAFMRALRAAGRGAQALDFYATTRRRLAEELGTDPGAELQALHQAILRGDPPAAPRAAVPAQLPRDVPGFAGRADDLARLHDLIPPGEEQPVAALISVVSGTAGVGKTALAVHFAHQVAARFPDGQLYVNLHGFSPTATRSATEAVRMFLEALGVPPGKVPADLDSLGGAHHERGDDAEAVDCYRQALALFRESGDRHLEATILTHLGDVQHATGEHDAARKTWRQALDILTDLDHSDADAVRAKVLALTGKYSLA
jgi:DNA-binding SARP family transcriptional activator